MNTFRTRCRSLAGAASIVTLAAIFVPAGAPAHGHPRARPRSPAPPAAEVHVQATVTLAAATRIPPAYFGLSTETWALPIYERHLTALERVLALLRVSGAGPLTLRVGGDSADESYWGVNRRSLPRAAFLLTRSWFRHTAALARGVGLRMILDLNLAADAPRMVGRWARAAMSLLPHRSVLGFEVGNEPDLYPLWRSLQAAPWPRSGPPGGYSASRYLHDFGRYAAALKHVAPTVALAAPALSDPAQHLRWLSDLVAADRGWLGILTVHRYPLSACARPGAMTFPTISRVLGESTTAGMAQSVLAAVRLAHHARLPLVVDELNSVTCGGLPGVSNAFATALWAPDALFELLRNGVDAVNVHIRSTPINAPFVFGHSGLQARPLLYGLILFARTLGRDARLLKVRLRYAGPARVKVWAVRVAGDELHVLVIDKGIHAATIRLQLPAAGPALVDRLLARAAVATSGVTLGGRQLGPDATWNGAPAGRMLARSAGGYQLTIPALSAALLTVPISRSPPASDPFGALRALADARSTVSAIANL